MGAHLDMGWVEEGEIKYPLPLTGKVGVHLHMGWVEGEEIKYPLPLEKWVYIYTWDVPGKFR